MKSIELCGLGNALVDLLIDVDDSVFASLGLEKGTMRLVDPVTQEGYIAAINSHAPSLASGGSVANSVVAFSQLGGKAAFMGTVADDSHGVFYKKEMEELGIRFPLASMTGDSTGTALCIITPDAERTMRTCLASSSFINDSQVDEATIKASEWLFLEGYLFANPENGQKAVMKGVELGRKHGTKIAITFSEPWVVESCREVLEEAVRSADIVFSNEHELAAFSATSDPMAGIIKLKGRVSYAVVTLGEKGALVLDNGEISHVEAFPCKPVDLTGAGDMFAGTFLYGIQRGLSGLDAARRACFLSSKVIGVVGARLRSGVPGYWSEMK